MTDRPNVVWIVVDRFHAGMLGPYGNAWIRTPNLNRLAADAFLFDQALIDTPALDGFYRGCWLGRHALTPLAADVGAKSLPAELAAANFETRLWTDDCSVANHSLAAEFAQTEVIPIESSRVAGELEDTHFARFFSAAIDGLQQLAAARNQGASGSRPFVAWLHTAGLGSVWDAPLEFRNQYADDEDALPPEAANVPTLMLREDFDPDELLGFVHAYAGQVSLLDACLGLLLDELQTSGLWQNTLLGVIGARGFPLGEHRRLGPIDDALFGELLHVPCFLRIPDGDGAGVRSSSLVQVADVHATLRAFCGLHFINTTPLGGVNLLPLVAGQCEVVRDRAVAINASGERAIRTAGWFLRATADSQQLFLKPDDRYEVNEVADRCPEVVAELRAALDDFQQVAESPAALPRPLAPLADVLIESVA